MWIPFSCIFGAALNCVDIYQKNTKNPHTELKELLGCRPVDNRR